MQCTLILRRAFVTAVASLAMSAANAQAPAPRIKVGLMLPATGTFAALGTAMSNGFRLYVAEQGGRLGGREVEFISVDDESDPAKATENANRLVKRDQVDVLVGTAHSGVALAMAKVARDTQTLMIIPNAGADELTGALCAPNIFRTSFSNWQVGYAVGQTMAERKVRTAVTMVWKYAAGQQMVAGFREAFEKGGGKVVKDMAVPFPNTEYQPYLTELAGLRPEGVFAWFAGAGGSKFLKDYAAAGLKGQIPLYSNFLTDGTLEAAGDAGQGILTTLHYAEGLESPRNQSFRLAYAKTYKLQPDVYAVQGYDAAQLLAAGLKAVGGDTHRKAEMIRAMEAARIDSPRGVFTLSRAHNPVQDFYLRKSEGRDNKLVSVMVKALADPAHGCKM